MDQSRTPWEDLSGYVALPRLGSLSLSPDGTRLVASISRLTHDATAYTSSLVRIDLDGGRPQRLTRSVEGESLAAFLRDGSLLFTSGRGLPADGPDDDRVKAVWCLPANGGEAWTLARRPGGFTGIVTARDADTALFTFAQRAGIDVAEAEAEWRKERAAKKVTAILHEGMPVRSWDHDVLAEDTVAVRAENLDGSEPLGADALTPVVAGTRGHLDEVLALSADGATALVSWRERLPRGQAAWSVALVDVASGEHRILAQGDARISFREAVATPDLATIACVRQVAATASEAPHLQLWVIDAASGEGRAVAQGWDRWGSPVGFAPDAATVYVSADEDGATPLFAVAVDTGEVRRLTDDAGVYSSVQISPDGTTAYAVRSAWDHPGQVVAIDLQAGGCRALDCGVEYPALPGTLQRIETQTSDGTRVPAYLALPAGADAENPAPLVLWVHGGPLGSWSGWSWRWCPWLLVSQGYAVLLPDPALSTGYGQDAIQRGWEHWGDRVFGDVMAATDAVEQRPEIDAEHTAMMGGSFGGYMANWIATHTDRFDAIVSHASLWHLAAFKTSTDATVYWDETLSAQLCAEQSPHLFADQITTPMLVIHGDKDYRVPISEGLALWWALVQRFDGDPADLPHKFLYFPDENHWVLKPQHAIVWYQAVRAFLATHLRGEEFVRPTLV